MSSTCGTSALVCFWPQKLDTKNKFYKKFRNTWSGMRQRCYNLKTHGYKFYGKKGITVCDRWHKFINFYNDLFDSFVLHAEENDGDTEIDRIDSKGNYCPENCRWLTGGENSSRAHLLKVPDKDDRSLGSVVYWERVNRKWSTETLAKEVGCKVRTIQKIERGEIKPSFCIKIFKELDIPLDIIDFPKKK